VTPAPAPAPDQSASPTSFLNLFIPKVYADELVNETTTTSEIATTVESTNDSVTAVSSTTAISNLPAPAEDSIFTILYTLDGKTWKSLGTVTQAEIGQKDFEIPIDNIQSQTDLSNIQINIQSATTLDQDLTVYLDGMSLSVQYDSSVTQIVQKESIPIPEN